MTATALLLVEDDPGIGGPLARGLETQAFAVTWARNGTDAVDATRREQFPLVLLDLGLPDVDGVALCRTLRERMPTAVIVALTARDTEMDVIATLDAGADDYLLKPFRFAELLARLRAHLRRTPSFAPAEPRRDAMPISVGKVELDLVSHQCTVDGTVVQLRPKEFDLLEVLLENAGRALSRDRLMVQVWGEDWYGSTKTLDMHIAMLRRRLGEHGEDPRRIATLRGHGYRYEADAGWTDDQ
jgi:DNA-binding response OmpR family regulator